MPPTAGDGGLFVYGSLLFPEVLLALVDRVPSRTPATAPGWRVAALPGRVYPGLVPGPGSAPGLLMSGLAGEDWDTLTAFEGDLYDLRRLSLAGAPPAWTFVWGASSTASSLDWVPKEFAERVLPAYVEGCRAWRQRYEAAPVARVAPRPGRR
ncbi:MAG: gamma-glutamylcyclotransferase [Candidatus Dormibacteraeota bacterium]|nr:gamma-glutamylcyclotransferase [Candidatus Dormibacteraeota bacterium]